jgi:hypothetical protein
MGIGSRVAPAPETSGFLMAPETSGFLMVRILNGNKIREKYFPDNLFGMWGKSGKKLGMMNIEVVA